MSRGTAYLKDWERRMWDEKMSVHTTSACSFCDWETSGPVGETSAAYTAHRLEAHPEVKPRPRKKRHRPFGQIPTNKTLDDNIRAARGQGAATWDGAA